MRSRNKKARIALVLCLLALIGLAAYPVVTFLRASANYRDAREALTRRDFRQAAAGLSRYLEVWPKDLEVRLLAAQTARRNGNHEEADRHLRLYQEQGGAEASVSLERRLARVQEGDLSEADLFLEFCDKEPESPDVPLVLEALAEGAVKVLLRAHAVGVASEEGVVARETAVATKAVGLWLERMTDPYDQAQGLVWRSQLHLVGNRHAAQTADLRKALDLAPDHFQSRLLLARAIAQEAPDEALAHLRELQRTNPDDVAARFALASVCRSLGRLEEARQLLEGMLAANPDDLSVLVELGKLALDERRPEEAERHLRRALTLAPGEPDINLTLSRCLQLTGQSAEAGRLHARFQQLEAERARQREELAKKIKEAAKAKAPPG